MSDPSIVTLFLDTTTASQNNTGQEAEASSDNLRGEVGADRGEIQQYDVVWGRAGSWPWWPGVASLTRMLGRNLLRKVEFFGCDHRGVNTHSYLVSGTRVVFMP